MLGDDVIFFPGITLLVKEFPFRGIGVIYTDFQVEGQGSRINFNPQFGIGAEFNLDSGGPFFSAIRLSHISNGGLHSDNRGVNSIVLVIGRFFSMEF